MITDKKAHTLISAPTCATISHTTVHTFLNTGCTLGYKIKYTRCIFILCTIDTHLFIYSCCTLLLCTVPDVLKDMGIPLFTKCYKHNKMSFPIIMKLLFTYACISCYIYKFHNYIKSVFFKINMMIISRSARPVKYTSKKVKMSPGYWMFSVTRGSFQRTVFICVYLTHSCYDACNLLTAVQNKLYNFISVCMSVCQSGKNFNINMYIISFLIQYMASKVGTRTYGPRQKENTY